VIERLYSILIERQLFVKTPIAQQKNPAYLTQGFDQTLFTLQQLFIVLPQPNSDQLTNHQ